MIFFKKILLSSFENCDKSTFVPGSIIALNALPVLFLSTTYRQKYSAYGDLIQLLLQQQAFWHTSVNQILILQHR